MSNELRGADGTGNVEYSIIFNRAGQVWNGSAFETYASIDYSDYDVAMTEEGTSGIYFGDFPAAITSSGTYDYFVKRQSGGSPAEDDVVVTTGKVDWTGSASAISIVGALSGSDWRDYVLRGGFKRTDKDTELYEETTDAIQELRRRMMFSEAEAETTTTDTITVLGDFKISVESDFGLLLGVVVEDSDTATPLVQVSKDVFNRLYPDLNVTADRGYPKHFTVYAGSIQIGPAPDRTSYVYRVTYSQRAGTITSATTSVPFTREYRDVLRDLALSKLFKIMEDLDKAQFYRAEYERGFIDSLRRERNNAGRGSSCVRPFGM